MIRFGLYALLSETKFRSRDKIIANLRYGDALAEAEEIGFSTSSSIEENLEAALSEMAQYQDFDEMQEAVEEELVHDDDDFFILDYDASYCDD